MSPILTDAWILEILAKLKYIAKPFQICNDLIDRNLNGKVKGYEIVSLAKEGLNLRKIR